MKFTKFFIIAALILGALTIGSSVTLAQSTQQTLVTATNLPATVATTVTTNCTSYFSMPNRTGFSLQYTFNVSAGTSNAIVYLYPTLDGTNYATVATFTNTATATGTTAVTQTWSFNDQLTRGVVGYKIGLYNQNSGTLTNQGILISRPTN